MKPSDLSEIPFTREAAVQMLNWGANPTASPYSHNQIADWCNSFWRNLRETANDAETQKMLKILNDVDAQWELYLTNTYSIEELQNKNFETEKMPIEWFHKWLEELA